MNAMAEHSVRGQHSTFLISVGVIARAHIKMVDLLKLFAVLRQMRLQVSFEPGREFRRAAHHFFRTSNGKSRTERVLEPALLSPMPFSAKAFALEQRNGEHFFGLELTVGAKIHHHFPENRANAAFLRCLE